MKTRVISRYKQRIIYRYIITENSDYITRISDIWIFFSPQNALFEIAYNEFPSFMNN